MTEGVDETPLPVSEAAEGYRGTETGDLPEGWRICRLDELVDLRRKTVNPERVPDLPYVGLEHIDSGNPVLQRYGLASEVKSNKSRFYPGDVLYGKLRPYLDKGVFATQEGICSTDILVFSTKQDFSREFLLYAVHTKSFIKHAVATTSGVNHPRTSWSSLRQYLLPAPPLEEQRAIAHVLDYVQRTREATEMVLALARELKRSLMSHLFTYGPIPVAEADQVLTKETEAGTIPEHWEVQRVGGIATVKSGGTPSRIIPEYWEGNDLIPWVKTAEINYKIIKAAEESISAQGLEMSSARLFPEGTLLMAMYGQGATRGRVAILGTEAAINQACAAISPDDRVSTKFLYHMFTFKYENLRMLGHGANQTNLSSTIIKQILVPIPLLEEQQQIVEALGAVDEKIAAEEARRDSLAALFGSLLEELMTGRLRVGDLPSDPDEQRGDER